MKQQLKTLKCSLGAAAAIGLLTAQQAYAAIPAGALTALDDAKTDTSTIGWAAFGVLVVAAAFKYFRRAV